MNFDTSGKSALRILDLTLTRVVFEYDNINDALNDNANLTLTRVVFELWF